MFDALSQRLGDVLEKLKGRAILSESDVRASMREIRMALLEADVALPVAKEFTDQLQEKAVGQKVLRSVSPGQMVVKIVHDELITLLGGKDADNEIVLSQAVPTVILMVGLQGSGKTTSTAKLAYRLRTKFNKKIMMASLDTSRPAAMDQLARLGEQTEVATLPVVQGQNPIEIAKRAVASARVQGYDAVLLDSAGRMAVDEALMAEIRQVRDVVNPYHTILVADALTGQDAVGIAERFHSDVGVNGLILTRVDGDGRGGAALSMKQVTGAPIRYLGVGERFDALESFSAERVANRILGMGDVVSLVEKAAATIEAEDTEKMVARLQKGIFDLNDMAQQMRQMRQMGGMSGVLGMLPGVGKAKKQLEASGMDDTVLKRQEAVISSMTKKERANPKLLNASRKKRVARGAGVDVQDVNKLLKMHRQMADMMKMMGKGKGKGGLAGLGRMLGGNMPDPSLLKGLGGKGVPGVGGGQFPSIPGLPSQSPGSIPSFLRGKKK
ncbi:MAG: signal recognition particle protein [Alphaproteobacteria bacterium]|jgi:signal recognition particle subunit SRP54|nr:signal recognition particle protein [Alphaproteobacteria bacterium]